MMADDSETPSIPSKAEIAKQLPGSVELCFRINCADEWGGDDSITVEAFAADLEHYEDIEERFKDAALMTSNYPVELARVKITPRRKKESV